MFRITIQLPFQATEVRHTGCSKEQSLALYQAMDWPGLDQQLFDRQGDVINHYYFFEIGRDNSEGGEELLHISGYPNRQISIDYVRPKWVKRGFFKKKDVLDPAFITHMEARSYAMGATCMQAFLDADTGFLEDNLYDKINGE